MNTSQNNSEYLKNIIDMADKHLPIERETDDYILKGHLILEYFMNGIILEHCPEGHDLRKGGFSFNQKIELMKIFKLFEGNNNFYEYLKSFNRLRNEVAHSLNVNKGKVLDLYNESCKLVFGEVQEAPKESSYHLVRTSIAFFIGYISGSYYAKRELDEQNLSFKTE